MRGKEGSCRWREGYGCGEGKSTHTFLLMLVMMEGGVGMEEISKWHTVYTRITERKNRFAASTPSGRSREGPMWATRMVRRLSSTCTQHHTYTHTNNTHHITPLNPTLFLPNYSNLEIQLGEEEVSEGIQ